MDDHVFLQPEGEIQNIPPTLWPDKFTMENF
ncbi:hypothetical protein PAAL109150_23470 [Paenibacillus alkaliterrae]